MENSKEKTVQHKRVNVSLPQDTLQLLDRLVEKGNRSAFLNRAVRFYVNEVGRANLRKELRRGALVRASRDLSLTQEWFPIDEEVMQ